MDPGGVIGWYGRHVTAPIAQAVQYVNDISPVSLDDLLFVALPVSAGLGAWYVLKSTSVPERLRRFSRVLTAAGGFTAYALTTATPGLQEGILKRQGVQEVLVDVADHTRSFDEHQRLAFELETAYRASAAVVPDATVCAQVNRVVEAIGAPVIRMRCATSESLLFRITRSYDEILGLFNPLSRTVNLSVPTSNYWRPWYLAHEMAHAQQFYREDEAELVAYLALATAQGEYAASLQQVAHLSRARDESIALHERTGVAHRAVLPQRAYDDLQIITGKRPPERQSDLPAAGEERTIDQARSSAPTSTARYTLSFLKLVHAWERAHGPDLLPVADR